MKGKIEWVDVVVLPDGRMDPKNASKYIGLSVKTLAIKRCNGTGPKFVKLGRIFYHQEDLDAWLERDRVRSTAQAQQIATVRGPMRPPHFGHRPRLATPEAASSGDDSGAESEAADAVAPASLNDADS